MHMFERFQKSSDNLPATTPPPPLLPPTHSGPLASPLRRNVFTQRLVSGHAYDVNIAS